MVVRLGTDIRYHTSEGAQHGRSTVRYSASRRDDRALAPRHAGESARGDAEFAGRRRDCGQAPQEATQEEARRLTTGLASRLAAGLTSRRSPTRVYAAVGGRGLWHPGLRERR